MGLTYLGEIRLMADALGLAPKGWARCDGQILSVERYTALFSLLGNTYGGDGTTNFALPDLRGRVVIGAETAANPRYRPGQTGGQETVALTEANLPPHNHGWTIAAEDATTPAAANNILARANKSGVAIKAYGSMDRSNPVRLATIEPVGGGKPHTNLQPFLALVYCIALEGVFPSRN